MNASIAFSPLAPWELIAAGGVLAGLMVLLSIWARAPGWFLRALAFATLLFALANPSLVREERDALPDIAFVVIDDTASQTIEPRPDQRDSTIEALDEALARLAARGDTAGPLDIRTIRVDDGTDPLDDTGTALLGALDEAASEVAPGRVAGAILVTDGRVHDTERLTTFPAPVHVLLTGNENEADYKLSVGTAPAFGLVGESVTALVTIEALGTAEPLGTGEVQISIDGEAPRSIPARIGEEVAVEIPITHGGANVIELYAPPAPGELTTRNNRAVFTVNGVRDRLRVLLVSGEPHPGERMWRNLLKADPSVDLVHFTILRPPAKQDGTPVYELSLIAFPTRELFLEKVDEFDLIIFDRYRRRGILPSPYIANIARYVRDGGALLIADGAAFAGVESLYRTPLSDVIPARPTAQVFEHGFRPSITETGQRHPVTADLAALAPAIDEEGNPLWGRWFRHVDVEPLSGETLMNGFEDRPLLVLERVGEGRVAVLASDHAWLWSRGVEGGGPQAEMLRRLSHWLMKEPELEEEALTASVTGATLTVTRRSTGEGPSTLAMTAPSGAETQTAFVEAGPGRWRAVIEVAEQGLHRLDDGSLRAVAAIGPAAPREFENPVSTAAVLAPLVEATGGAVMRLADAVIPDIRRVRAGRVANGRGWLGLVRRDAFAVADVRLTPLAPGWMMLLLTALLLVAAWRVESR